MMTQAEKVLMYLDRHGSITTLEAFEHLGISRLSARIWDIRHMTEFDIKSEMITVKNRFGDDCCVAKYSIKN